MRLKHIVKPTLISFLRYLDKNKILLPHRIRYSSFRSKKDMCQDLYCYYDVSEDDDLYIFTLKPSFQYLVAPHAYYFSKVDFRFLDIEKTVIDLESCPVPPSFHIRHGRFLIEI